MMREADKKKQAIIKDEEVDLSSFIQERSMMIDEGLRGQNQMSYDSIKYDVQQSDKESVAPVPLPNVDDTKLDFSELQSEAPKKVVDDYGVEDPVCKPIVGDTGSPVFEEKSVTHSKKSVRFSEENEPQRVQDDKIVSKPQAPSAAKKLGSAPREMVPANALSAEARKMIQ